MIGISDYAVVTGKSIRTPEQIASFCSEQILHQMHEIGLSHIPTDNEKLLSDMITEVYHKINKKPDCILIAHSLPFIQKNNDTLLEFLDIPVFTLSGLPCAIMHKAIEAAVKLIQNGIYQKIMVIGADKTYSDEERVFFNTIMGDAVVALLLCEKTAHHKILASHISTKIYAPDGENSFESDIQKFRSANASMMRSAIKACLQKANVSHADYFVTHTSNRKFWDSMSLLTKVPREKFLDDNICNTGHMNSHDSFLHYFYFYEQKIISAGKNVMLINPGFGGTQGCTLIRT